MLQRLFAFLDWTNRDTVASALPLYGLMTVVYGVLFGVIVASEALVVNPVNLLLFSTLFWVHTLLHWLVLRFASGTWGRRSGLGLYCLVQGALVVAMSVLTTHRGILMGLYVTLLAETEALSWPRRRPMLLAGCFFVGLLVLNTVLVWGVDALVESAALTGLLFAGVLVYAVLFVRESRTREQAQALLHRLEIAHRHLQEYADQVEELTIGQERQRLARELHDTLAQGLAGLILQLEAIDSHLEDGHLAQARAAVQQAMLRARQTLHEARAAIHALRSPAVEQADLGRALESEVARFENDSGLATRLEFEGQRPTLSPATAQEVLRIVQEGLANIARHAQAHHVLVLVAQHAGALQITVQDDGSGFSTEEALQRPGCFGLEGIMERARRLGAELQIESSPGRGTSIVLSLGAESPPVQAAQEPGE